MKTNSKLKKIKAYKANQESLRIKAIKLGVNLIAPETIFLSSDTKFGKNVTINPYVVIGKKVKIIFVKDRPGHDKRYALNSNKIKKKLKWNPKISFNKGIKLTFEWYKDNKSYYKSLSKKDIVKRLGNKWLKKELY